MYLLTPRDYFRVAAILQNSETGVSTPTFVLIAILAGVSEEILFRGALQPKFGIILTATAFALVHVQYGPSLILAVIFIHGLGYGLLRRYLDTTAAISAHLMYDLAAFVPISHRLIGLIGLSLLAVGFIRNRLAPGVPDDSEGEAV
jgi:membrane protease YdiL (CAAX protease family)